MKSLVIDFYAIAQALQHLVIHLAKNSRCVFAVDTIARMHQAVGKLTVIGKQQQAAGVDVQAADIDPTAALDTRQILEDIGPVLFVATGANHTGGFVVSQHMQVLAATTDA